MVEEGAEAPRDEGGVIEFLLSAWTGITGQDPFEAAAFGRHPSRSTSERAAEQSATKAIYFRKR